MAGRKKMRPKAHRAAKFKPGQKVPKIVLDVTTAAEALRIYRQGGNRETFVKRFGVPIGPSGRPMNAEELIAESCRLFAGQEALQQAAAEALRELGKIGRSDIRRIFTEAGGLQNPTALDDETAAAVQSVEVVTKTIPIGDGQVDIEHTHKIKMYDKVGPLRLILQAAGALVEKHEHGGPDGGPLTVEIVRFGDDKAAGK